MIMTMEMTKTMMRTAENGGFLNVVCLHKQKSKNKI